MDTLKLRPFPYNVFQDIPSKEVIFFRNHDVIITCFDASSNYLVFGTNVGCSYLSHRNSKYLIKILCDSRKEEICCVKLHEGVDCQIAMATKDGHLLISAFSLDISQENKKQRRKYVLGKIHNSDVTSLQWSVNGMKLFSADCNGNVFMANIDFHMNSCSSEFVTKATDDVITHMDYRHRHLLIVTSQGQIVIHSLETSKNDVIVEQDALGACYNYDVTISERQLLVYVTLPQSCIRVFNIDGFLVTSYKDVTSNVSDKIEICLNSTDDDTKPHGEGEELKLGRIRNLNKNQILSFTDDTIVVYDHVASDVIAYIRDVSDLCDVATTQDDEILLFVRHNQNGRKMLRIARTNERRLAAVGLEEAEPDVIDNIEKQLRVRAENLWSFSQKFSNFSSDAVDSIGTKLKKQIEDVGENIRSRMATSQESEDDVIALEEGDDVTSQTGSITSASSELRSYDRKSAAASTSVVTSQASGVLFESKLRKMKKRTRRQTEEQEEERQEEKQQQQQEKSEANNPKHEDNHKEESKDATEANNITNEQEKGENNDTDDVTPDTDDVTAVEEEERRLFERLNFSKVTISPMQTPIIEDVTFDADVTATSPQQPPPDATTSSSNDGDDSEDDDVIDFYARSDDDNDGEGDGDDEKDHGESMTSSQAILRHQQVLCDDVTGKNDDTISIGSSLNLDMENMVTFKLARDQNAWSVCPAPSKNMSSIYAHRDKICVVTNSNRIWVAEEEQQRRSGHDYDVTTLRWHILSKYASDISITSDVLWTADPLGAVKCAPLPSSGGLSSRKAAARWRPLNLKWSSVELMTSQQHVRRVCLMTSSSTSAAAAAWMITADGHVIERCDVTGRQPNGGLPERRIHVAVRDADGNALEPEMERVCSTSATLWLLSRKGKLFCKETSTTRWLPVPLPDGGGGGPPNDDVIITRLASDDVSTVFVVDGRGCVWFRSGIAASQPEGRAWWQVHLNNYVYGSGGSGGGGGETKKLSGKKIAAFLHNLANVAAETKSSEQHTSSVNYDVIRSADVAISRTSVWILTQNNVLFTARGAITGYQWWTPHIEGLTSYCKWHGVTSSSIFSPESATWEEYVWVSRHSGGELLRLHQPDDQPPHGGDEESSITRSTRASVLMPPKPNCDVTCLSACKDALWVVTSSGEMFCRRGITFDLPLGRDWQEVDISLQFGDVTMRWVSCGSGCVWGVDSTGNCHMRIGTSVSHAAYGGDVMVAAWLPVESPSDDVIFKEVTCGPSSVNVWALDTKGRVYVRNDVTDEFPVGKKWTLVEGVPIRRIAISNHTVWAVSYWGNLLERCGIDNDNVVGDYWNQKITKIIDLAVTPQDQLWCINHEHRLKRFHKKIYKTPINSDVTNHRTAVTSSSSAAAATTDEASTHVSDDVIADEWEML